MPQYSVIIPVYNRPEEVHDLLESLNCQTNKDFEIIIVEDGSDLKAEDVVRKFEQHLKISYYLKPNTGPGLSRNYGAERAEGRYLIFFDSDCIIPENYIAEADKQLKANYADCYGGPDKAHSSFSPIQKAINYSMTSFFTTGGIRGGKQKMDKFYPRSFNMGFSKEVFEKTKGFSSMRFGEDLDFSMRVLENGFTTALYEDAYVYHKRRSNFRKFYKQVYNSGIARINLFKRHPGTLKTVHMLPSAFVVFSILLLMLSVFNYLFLLPLLLFALLIFADSLIQYNSLKISSLSVISSVIQLYGYGIGFLSAVWKRIILGKNEFNAFEKNFYK